MSIMYEAEVGDLAKSSALVDESKGLEPSAEVPTEPAAASSSDVQGVTRGQKHADETCDDDSHKRVKFAEKGFSMLEAIFLLDDSEVGQQAPKTPKRDDNKSEQHLSQVTSADRSLYEHEDTPVSFTFESNHPGQLENYELTFDDDEF